MLKFKDKIDFSCVGAFVIQTKISKVNNLFLLTKSFRIRIIAVPWRKAMIEQSKHSNYRGHEHQKRMVILQALFFFLLIYSCLQPMG